MGLQQIKSFYTAKEKHSKQPIEWEKYPVNMQRTKKLKNQKSK
jgi:hypothetical protein